MGCYFFCLYFFVYGFGGWCTEVAYAAATSGRFVNRGFLNGPICPIYGLGVSFVVAFLTPVEEHLVLLYLASTILVTALEGATGFVLDRIFHHKWWDYSNRKFNIGGYICPMFSAIWGVACVLIVRVVHPVFHRVLALLPVALGVVLIVICGGVMFADLYVTSSTILKFNRRLASMERIAVQLHEVSDKLGEDIYENVTENMEKTEKVKERLSQLGEEERERLHRQREEERARLLRRQEELKAAYAKLSDHRNAVTERLMKAFPTMRSREHDRLLRELRERLRTRS